MLQLKYRNNVDIVDVKRVTADFIMCTFENRVVKVKQRVETWGSWVIVTYLKMIKKLRSFFMSHHIFTFPYCTFIFSVHCIHTVDTYSTVTLLFFVSLSNCP